MDVIRHLTGHSGCTVLLCRQDGRTFIRKVSGSPGYNGRLLLQAAKQDALGRTMRTPRVWARGEVDGLAYVDMEYVAGYDVTTYLSTENHTAVPVLARRLVGVLDGFARTGRGELRPEPFRAKVEEVREAVRRNPLAGPHAARLGPLVAALLAADWSGIARTDCHGDFTLENMLFMEDGGIAFLDTLDGALESFWLDAAKLLQDLASGWSMRHTLWLSEPGPTAALLRIWSRHMRETLTEELRLCYPALHARLGPLRALQALRVLPYVDDARVFAGVMDGLTRLHEAEHV